MKLMMGQSAVSQRGETPTKDMVEALEAMRRNIIAHGQQIQELANNNAYNNVLLDKLGNGHAQLPGRIENLEYVAPACGNPYGLQQQRSSPGHHHSISGGSGLGNPQFVLIHIVTGGDAICHCIHVKELLIRVLKFDANYYAPPRDRSRDALHLEIVMGTPGN